MRKKPLDEGLRWLNQAEQDLKWTKHLFEQGAWYLACFLSQQVTEKALKAFLYSCGEEIVLGHSVARLCSSAANYNPIFSDKASRWNILDGYYVPTRYPNGVPDGIPADVFTKQAAQDAVEMAEEAVSLVGQLLEEA